MYYKLSVKSQERMRRGESDKFLIRGPKTRRPPDFKNFLNNSENKIQLFKLLLNTWKTKNAAPHVKGREVFLIVERTANEITSTDGV